MYVCMYVYTSEKPVSVDSGACACVSTHLPSVREMSSPCGSHYRGTSLIGNTPFVGPYSRPVSRALQWS